MKLTNIIFAFALAFEEDSTGQELMRVTNELPSKAAPYPVKRVDRLVKLLNQWADRWIGAENGLIGFYEKPEKFQIRLHQVARTFKRNILLCNPDLLADENELPEDIQRRGNGCQGNDDDAKSCSIFEAFERVKGFERLQRDYMQCSKLNDKRLDGIEKRMLKLKRIIINSVCQAHAMSTSNLYSESSISIEGNRFILFLNNFALCTVDTKSNL